MTMYAQGPRTTSSMLMVDYENFRIDLEGAVTLICTYDLLVIVDR